MSKRVLWADDDAPYELSALADLLRSRGLETDVAADAETACHFLEERRYDAVLSDAILPAAMNAWTIPRLKVARVAAESGVATVVFLTKVRQCEISEEFEALKNDYPAVLFSWIDKLSLLEGDTIDRMVELLSRDK